MTHAGPTDAWPSTLPVAPLDAGFIQRPDLGTVRSNVGMAQANQLHRPRPRYVTAPVSWIMTPEQLIIFEAWTDNQASYGAAFFDIPLYLDYQQFTVKARFKEGPEIEYHTDATWLVSALLEIVKPSYFGEQAFQLLLEISLADLLAMQTALTPPPTLEPFFTNYQADFPA